MQEVQKYWKPIEKDVGFSLCTALPLYHVSLHLWKSTEAKLSWEGSKGGMTKVWGLGFRVEA